MRISLLMLAAVVMAGCTKKNPEACCVDAVDCAAVGLPEGSTCEPGLLCRENRCVELTCSTSAQCDVLAPYCAAETASCQATCRIDDECPGFGQSTAEQFCETGSCVACRANMNDCPTAMPICDAGACRACERHSDCTTAVCEEDGTCAPEGQIAYVAPSGSPISGCTRAEPCRLSRALDIAIGRPYVLLASGSYLDAAVLTVSGRTSIIGDGSPRPTITRTVAGPIFTLAFGAEATFDNVEIRGARSGTNLAGYGIECPATANATDRVFRSLFTNNDAAAMRAQNCTLEVRETTFDRNFDGISVTDSKVTVDRCTLTGQSNKALSLDGGLFAITNNFIVRNATGADLFPNGVGTVFEFNTIADNSSIGVLCQVINNQGTTLPLPNNLIARNTMNLSTSADCVFSSSMVIASDIAPLKFKSPDALPYDYHLTTGSMAVDQISSSTQPRDFDGEMRPNGTGFDYGADELH